MRRTPLRRKKPLRPYKERSPKAKLNSRKAALRRLGRTLNEELDDLVRQYVLLRDNFRCCKCGRKRASHNPGTVLHASHIYPKGKYRSMRHEVDNVIALCYRCHRYWWHLHPIEAAAWIRMFLPPARWARLQIMAGTTRKVDQQATKLWLEQQLARP